MLDSLELLVITFMVMSVVSVMGVVVLFFTKKEKIQKASFYFLAIWGMIIAYCNVQTCLWTGEMLLAWALGGLSVAALLIQLCLKKKDSFKIAKILVAVSVVVGMIDCFIFSYKFSFLIYFYRRCMGK